MNKVGGNVEFKMSFLSGSGERQQANTPYAAAVPRRDSRATPSASIVGSDRSSSPSSSVSGLSDARYAILRQEIIEAQRSGTDILKWKLIAVASVASIGVGLWVPTKGQPVTDARLILCVIPIICAYADMVSLDLAVRILVIANYLRITRDPYEEYVYELRGRDDNPFHAASIASHGSSLAASLLILGLGLVGAARRWDTFHISAFITGGVLGAVATGALWAVYKTRVRRLAVRKSDYETNYVTSPVEHS
jgi:hypothetical protein